MLKIVSFLDRRFKHLTFLSDSEQKDIKSSAISELTQSIEKNQTSDITQKNRGSPAVPSCIRRTTPSCKENKKLEDFFEGMIESRDNSSESDPIQIATSEIEQYIIEPPVPLTSANPLIWWQTRFTRYKYLSILAKKILCIPATNVPSERVFSTVGNLITEKRSRLKPENVSRLIFLYENLSQF